MNIMLRLSCVLLAIGVNVAPLDAGWMDSVAGYFRKSEVVLPPTIKILIAHDKPGVILEVKGKYKIYDPHTGDHISTRFVGKRKFIQAVKDGLKWGEEFPGVYQLMIVPDAPETTTIVNGVEYHGLIFVYDIGGSISVVNQVYIEDYLASILAQQYRQNNDELLAAIVIAARTNAYYRAENPRSPFFSVDGERVGYQGYAAVDPSSSIDRAIKATRYMVMSKTGTGDSGVVSFPAEFKQNGQVSEATGVVLSQITLEEADAMAQRGDHAAQILAKAFPGTKIELNHYAPEKPLQAHKGVN